MEDMRNSQGIVDGETSTTGSTPAANLSSISSLIAAAYALWRRNLWSLLGILVLLCVTYLLIHTLGRLLSFAADSFGAGDVAQSILLLLAMFSYTVTHIVFTCAWVKRIQRGSGVIESIRSAMKRIPAACVFSVISLLILSIIWAPQMLSYAVPGITQSIGSILVVGATLASFIFGIYFSQALLIWSADTVSAREAYQKSYRYVFGRWWAVFIRLLVIGIVLVLPILLLFILFGVFYSSNLLSVIIFILLMFYGLVALPTFFICFLYTIYHDLATTNHRTEGGEIPVMVFTGIGILVLILFVGLLFTKPVTIEFNEVYNNWEIGGVTSP